jgi:glycosyltransferase involved in cell wall biosynthesis
VPNPFFIDRGGVIRVYQEIKSVVPYGIRVHVVCYHLGRNVPEATIHRIPYVPMYRRLSSGANIHRLYLDLLLMLKVYRVGVRIRPDIIHAHLHEGVFASLPLKRKYATPLLFDAQGSMTAEMRAHGFALAPLFFRLERYLCRSADCIIGSSSSLLQHMKDRFGIPADILRHFRDAVDTEPLLHGAPRQHWRGKYSIPIDAPVVVSVGLLNRVQGTDLLIETAARVQAKRPDVRFLVGGFPDEKAWSRNALGRGVRNMHFTGRIEYGQVREFLSSGTVAVSTKRPGSYEGNGKLLDYMTAGLPVVAFDTAANRELLGEHGRYAVLEDCDGFAGAIIDQLEKPSEARRRGELLRSRVEREFSWRTRAPELLDIYRSIIK